MVVVCPLLRKIKWNFNAALSFNKLWNTKILWKWTLWILIGVFSRDNLPKKEKDGAYVINLDEYKYVGTHWIALLCNGSEIGYFNSFGAEHIPNEI